MTEPDLCFQHYKVLRQADGSHWELGRGSMGITYKAFDVNLCCEVALKVINAATLEHPHARERFVSEARAAAKLRHRNIASVYHLGNDGAHYFYAMEFVDGETLDALVRRQGALPVATALRILLQAARALAAASRQGLVHRDLKPANIMVTREDDDDDLLVKVIDFGLAKPVHSADGSRPLTFGGFVGTPQFASPEQLEERPVDARSDIYSLGGDDLVSLDRARAVSRFISHDLPSAPDPIASLESVAEAVSGDRPHAVGPDARKRAGPPPRRRRGFAPTNRSRAGSDPRASGRECPIAQKIRGQPTELVPRAEGRTRRTGSNRGRRSTPHGDDPQRPLRIIAARR